MGHVDRTFIDNKSDRLCLAKLQFHPLFFSISMPFLQSQTIVRPSFQSIPSSLPTVSHYTKAFPIISIIIIYPVFLAQEEKRLKNWKSIHWCFSIVPKELIKRDSDRFVVNYMFRQVNTKPPSSITYTIKLGKAWAEIKAPSYIYKTGNSRVKTVKTRKSIFCTFISVLVTSNTNPIEKSKFGRKFNFRFHILFHSTVWRAQWKIRAQCHSSDCLQT